MTFLYKYSFQAHGKFSLKQAILSCKVQTRIDQNLFFSPFCIKEINEFASSLDFLYASVVIASYVWYSGSYDRSSLKMKLKCIVPGICPAGSHKRTQPTLKKGKCESKM